MTRTRLIRSLMASTLIGVAVTLVVSVLFYRQILPPPEPVRACLCNIYFNYDAVRKDGPRAERHPAVKIWPPACVESIGHIWVGGDNSDTARNIRKENSRKVGAYCSWLSVINILFGLWLGASFTAFTLIRVWARTRDGVVSGEGGA